MIDPHRKIVAFIDEFGDSGLDLKKANTSSHFIVTAIIMDEDKIPNAERKIEEIRTKYFQTAEIKSSSVKNKQPDRRIKILTSMMDIDFAIFSIVIDKSKLVSEGFKYHNSFFKFCHRLVHTELYKAYPNLKIVADNHGDNKYILSFIKYVQKQQFGGDLFNQSSFIFDDSKSSKLIQIADFIGGTIAKGRDKTVLSPDAPRFYDIIKNKVIAIKEWPNNYPSYTYEPQSYNEFDSVIAEYSLRAAEKYIERYKKSKDVDTRNRMICLRYMLFYFRNIEPDKYIPTKELMNRVKMESQNKMAMQKFRSDIIAKMRDDGVLIASSSKGYKIPMNVNDIYDFLNRSNNVVAPLISRVLSARQQILLATQNHVDILDQQEYANLRKLIN